ncbi:pyridoxine 4-dehydrogenase [Fusarium napiforme]|uniref:Pyridoxine 4-dehydrogenase n=1 Tax=Fusarium napiforme TaxID=42672 RepID=A0A8H5JUK2_9HYPO|nr:pyridoxine 4-dehydrogenase [Fusarium napiforme]
MPEILGKHVGALGYGLMAFANGCNLWSGAEFHGPPEYNSMTLINAYFTKFPEDAEKITIAIKGTYNPDTFQLDGSPENKEYVDTGKVGGIALSECSAETIEEAIKHVKVALVEVECSLFSPDILKNGVTAARAKHNIPIMAYAPIGRGMLTGRFADSSQFQDQGIASGFPRFRPESFQHNLKLVGQVKAVAERKGITSAQLAINWVRGLNSRKGMPTIIPTPGATTTARVEENAQYFPLSEEEMTTLEDIIYAFEVSGGRYPEGVPMEA